MPVSGERLLRAVSQVPWAILPEKLEAILDVIEFRMSGIDLDAEDVRGQFAGSGDRTARQKGAVVVLPLRGIISQRMNLMTEFSGGTSTEKFGDRFDQAMANEDVSAIVIDIDSPGGNVEGVEELATKIFEAREEGDKEIIAVVNSLMASAAYWIGSSAEEIVITPSGLAGSIGVFAVHTEFSRFEEDAGITRTLVKAGRFKAEANDFQSLSDEAEGHMQEVVDEYFSMFVDAVARNRDVNPAVVRNGLGQGRTLPARQAVDAGLADRIATLEEVLEELGVDRGRVSSARAEENTRIRSEESTRTIEPTEVDSEKETTTTEAEAESAGSDGAEPTESADPPNHDAAPNQAVKEPTMSAPDTAAQDGAAETPTVEVGEERALEKERKRTREIMQLCSMHGMSDQAEGYIASGASVERVGYEIAQQKGNAQEPVMPEPQDPAGLSPEDSERYSLVRAIREAAQGDQMPTGFERDIHQELASKLGGARHGGFLVPTFLGPLPRRYQERAAQLEGRPSRHPDRAREDGVSPRAALDTGTANAGQEFVFTEPGSFIDMLRTRMVTTRLGATFLPGLEGNVSFPKQTGAGTFSWRAEEPGSDVSDSDATTDQVQLQPNDGTSSTAYSRRFLAQSVIDVEQFIRNDLSAIAARGIDLAALHGAGGNEPTGIYNASGVNSVAMGGAISWAKVVDLETQVVADDADLGVMAYATTPEVRGAAKTTEKASNTAQFLWTGTVLEGEMNGFRAMASNQIKKNLGTGNDEHGIIFGVWDQLLIGEWGALEIVVDPYSKKKQGLVEVTLFVIADVAVRHAEAFSKGTGLTV